MNWLPVFTPTFRHGYAGLDKPVQEKVDKSIENLLAAVEPSELGHGCTAVGKERYHTKLVGGTG